MPSEQRREREKQELRQAILTAAYEIAEDEDWQAVTIRKVAERIEYSPPTIYEHFGSKEELLLELRRTGYRHMIAAMQSIDRTSIPDEQQWLLWIDFYWDFAWNKTAYYRLIQGMGVNICKSTDMKEDAMEARSVFRQLISDLLIHGGGQIEDLDDIADILRGIQDGLINIAMQGRIRGGRERAQQLARKAVVDLLTAWGVRFDRQQLTYQPDRNEAATTGN